MTSPPPPGPPPAFRCAAAARDRDDPQLGSAPQARRWLLIEHRGPWQIDALAGSGISAAMLRVIRGAVHTHQARPLLIRRPGRASTSPVRAWAVTYDDEAVTQWGTWQTDEDLYAAVEALALPEAPADASTEPLLLACTHGVHDVCCALRGRPVAAALAATWPDETWECSHVGGDRFAANLVVLPDGVYYGNLDPESSIRAVRAHLRGEVDLEHLRGMTRVPPPAQVAIAAVHERFGPFAARDVLVVGIELRSAGVWDVQLAVPSAHLTRISATVHASRRDVATLTCRAGAETSATQYAVHDLASG
ncbi:MAG: sucrase ferredoxin [Propionibacteriaceae bacterium]